MAYMSHDAGLSRSERETDERPRQSTNLDMVRVERDARVRFTDGMIDEDLPTIDRAALSKDLEDAVRQAVIPRLYARQIPDRRVADTEPRGECRNGTAPMPANPASAIIAAGAVEHLHRLALSGRIEEQHHLLHDLYEQSVPIRSLMEDVVVPVANEIGRAWVDDEMSFAEVTLTIGRMQSAVATFTAATLEARGEAGTPHILLAPVPGEQHVFGAAVLGNLLSAEGYETETMLEAGVDELCGRLGARDYAAIGLSCNSDRTLRLLPALIADLRSASKNKDIKILLGGWAFNEEDESLHSLGADLIVTDRRSAVEDIVKLVDLGP